MKLAGKQVLVIGLGETGLSMAKWLTRQGARLRVADSRKEPPNVAAMNLAAPHTELITGPFVDAILAGVDLIAISPGVAVREPVVQQAMARGLPVVSDIELFAWGLRELSPSAKVIAITGSNGKTTTTALTAHLLNAAGVAAIACGNISPSALDALIGVADGAPGFPALPTVWVLELSSFQLETTHTLAADAAALLNVSEDHLDRHPSMDDYAAIKARVFEGRGAMIVNRDDPRSLAAGLGKRNGRKLVSFGLDVAPGEADFGIQDGRIVRGDEALIALSEFKLAGLHNAANAMAALALCAAIGVAPGALLPALARFTGLAHRVEFVAQIGAVDYYDDSKGTNVGATLAAIQGMGRKVAVILGGEGKGQDFTPLEMALARHARAVALIGRDAPLIGVAIAGCGVPVQHCADLAEAVRWCADAAHPGDAVLLSPACASFDMFRNYGHRAEVFVAAVRVLEGEGA